MLWRFQTYFLVSLLYLCKITHPNFAVRLLSLYYLGLIIEQVKFVVYFYLLLYPLVPFETNCFFYDVLEGVYIFVDPLVVF